MYLIPGSSPIHPLILLTYSPNPVIPRSFFPPPPPNVFIHLSPNPVISRSHPLPPSVPVPLYFIPAPFPSHPLSLPSPPPPPSIHFIFPSQHPSIPLDPVLARLSRCLNAWHQGFFFFFFFSPCRVQSLPYENAAQGTALSCLQIKRLLTIQCWKVTELSQEEKGAMQRNVQVEV